MAKCDVIHAFRKARQQVAVHPFPRLAVLLPVPGAFEEVSVSALEAANAVQARHRLAVPLLELRLVLERIHLADGARTEYLDNALSLAGEVGLLNCGLRIADCGIGCLFAKEAGEGYAAEAGAHCPEES